LVKTEKAVPSENLTRVSGADSCIFAGTCLLLSIELYRMTRRATMLPMDLGVGTAVVALAITVAMCSVSAALALNKIRSADPAEIF